MSADGGGVVASEEGPKTSCALKLWQLLHVRLQSTGDTTSGEGSAPGLRYTVVAGDHSPPQSSTDMGVRSARWHHSPADTCCVTVLACQEDLAETQPSVDTELDRCQIREAGSRCELYSRERP